MQGAVAEDAQVSRDDFMDGGGRAMQGAVAEAWMPGATGGNTVIARSVSDAAIQFYLDCFTALAITNKNLLR